MQGGCERERWREGRFLRRPPAGGLAAVLGAGRGRGGGADSGTDRTLANSWAGGRALGVGLAVDRSSILAFCDQRGSRVERVVAFFLRSIHRLV
jgi:hypothetical protein